ncbi:hypothetical protein MX850_03610 [Erysipelothrix sp. Poltava]|nr:hypothetical protein MX850_03610 [Erysipelothrix sp. Poltava]
MHYDVMDGVFVDNIKLWSINHETNRSSFRFINGCTSYDC